MIYKYLYSDDLYNFIPTFKGNKYKMNDNQQSFCDDLLNDIPLILEYDPNNHYHDRLMIFSPVNENELLIGITSSDSSSYQSLIVIEDKPLSEWRSLNENGFTYLSDLSSGYDVNLLPLVKNWLINYERKLKINNLISII